MDTDELLEVRSKFKKQFTLVLIIVGFHVGYIMAYTNQTTQALTAKFGWDGEAKTMYSSFLGSFGVGAMGIGSSVGGKWISRGRVRVLDMAAYLGIFGVSLSLVQEIPAILVGRVFYGFSSGLIAVAWPRYMEEVLPPQLISFYGGLYCFSFAIATIIAYLLALGLPPDNDVEALKADFIFWRIIWGLPIPVFLLQLFLMR